MHINIRIALKPNFMSFLLWVLLYFRLYCESLGLFVKLFYLDYQETRYDYNDYSPSEMPYSPSEDRFVDFEYEDDRKRLFCSGAYCAYEYAS